MHGIRVMLPLAVVLNRGLLFTIISAVLARRDRRSAAAPPSELDAAPPGRPDRARVALRCPVGALHATLTGLEQSGVVVEHVYDY